MNGSEPPEIDLLPMAANGADGFESGKMPGRPANGLDEACETPWDLFFASSNRELDFWTCSLL